MKDFLLCLWQLPQHLIGLGLVKLFTNGSYEEYHAPAYAKVYRWRYDAAVSFGRIIIIHTRDTGSTPRVKAHELGHSCWSKWIGLLYLILQGLPSLIGNIIWHLSGGAFDYYKQPWERAADKAAGVVRK